MTRRLRRSDSAGDGLQELLLRRLPQLPVLPHQGVGVAANRGEGVLEFVRGEGQQLGLELLDGLALIAALAPGW